MTETYYFRNQSNIYDGTFCQNSFFANFAIILKMLRGPHTEKCLEVSRIFTMELFAKIVNFLLKAVNYFRKKAQS